MIAIAVIFICLYLKCRSKHGQRSRPDKSSEQKKHTFSFPSFAFVAKLCKKSSEPKEPQNTAVSPRSLNYDMERTLSNITEVSEPEEHPQDMNVSQRQTRANSTKHTAKASLQTKLVEALKENDTVSLNGQMFTDISKQNLSPDISVSNDEVIAIDKKALDDNDENIEVTRLIENKTGMSKDVPFVNSTEHIFQEYDAAMSYASSMTMTDRSKTESELTPNMSIRRRKDEKVVNVVKPFGEKHNSFGLLSSKTESHIKMSKRKHPSRLHKSEFNIINALKKESQTLARKSHLKKSFSRSNSLEWNFEYVSPYAMTLEQKEALMERKRKLQKRKENSEKKKRAEKEKREKECEEVYEKWLQKKKELKNNEQSD
ncbi:microtubule-associated protein 9-like isoform X2 [Dreissena polymorpha]|nr:microtubule-associated protein 9-like isoform X2 [Dreissena polymorpha]